MPLSQHLHGAKWILALLGITAFLTAAHGQERLKTIDNPGGGQIVYGPLAGSPSLREAMVTMLRNVHNHFGDRPEIGRFYQARGTNSAATFFTVTAKSLAGRRIRGMVIVATSKLNQSFDAAVIYDDADRFDKTWNVMMNKLNQVWQQDYPQPTQSAQPAVDSSTPLPVPCR